METQVKLTCCHCGEPCSNNDINMGEEVFCCVGCKSVYSILHQHNLTDYYCLNEKPGNTMVHVNKSKFNFLDDESIHQKLISFKNAEQTRVEFFLPQIHCSSCLWLLEHLHKLHEGIMSAEVNFNEKKVKVAFRQQAISLRQVAELLTSIGYEPHITLQDYEEADHAPNRRKDIVKLGLVGFCFANIMLISFPEYLGLDLVSNPKLASVLRFANLTLALPVFFYGAWEFFVNAWVGIKQRFLNIDAPISLAILMTFGRSLYEIISQTGAGYLDSMSGIVFFMLIGRGLQKKTFTNLKFNRDYKSYFPIAVTIIRDGIEHITKIQEVQEGDVLRVQHQEIIPVDSLLSSKSADIDYSFVTGENETTKINTGEIIYAGGKVAGPQLEVIAVKPFSQSHFTGLWNNQAFTDEEKPKANFVELISRYFSLVLLMISVSGFVYWKIMEPANAWNAMTAVLIVACPCTLLLASSYTYGFIIDWFSREGMFVKSSNSIDKLINVDHVVFDKTGTISEISKQEIIHFALNSNANDLINVISVMKHSTHPLSKMIVEQYKALQQADVHHIKEIPGQGIEAWFDEQHIKIGKASFANVNESAVAGSHVYYSIDGEKQGVFVVKNHLRSGVEEMIHRLKDYQVSLLSGDTSASFEQMKHIFPENSTLLFQQSPQQKLDYIKSLQEKHQKVLMIGDGMNDAGALKQSDVGVSVVQNYFSFSPASDAILNSDKVAHLLNFMQAAKSAKRLIVGTFIYSLFYNAIGLSIAVSANLKPVVAAILMPASSISVILIAFLGTQWIHQKYFKPSKSRN